MVSSPEECGQPETRVDNRLRATFLQPPRAWDAAAQAGAALSLSDAIACALDQAGDVANAASASPGGPRHKTAGQTGVG
jgi:hypothetical protein